MFFTACASPPADDNATGVSGTAPATSTAAPDTSMSSVWKDVNSSNAPTIPAGSQPATQITTAALNPAHGQPNHRCDIQVGAPLNSPVQPMQQTLPSAPFLPATGAQGSVKINPAHGQPGHDCAVAVGAPLK